MEEPTIKGKVRAVLAVEDEFDLAEVTNGWEPSKIQALIDRESEAVEALHSELAAILRGRSDKSSLTVRYLDEVKG
jgi:hypothetical protein